MQRRTVVIDRTREDDTFDTFQARNEVCNLRYAMIGKRAEGGGEKEIISFHLGCRSHTQERQEDSTLIL